MTLAMRRMSVMSEPMPRIMIRSRPRLARPRSIAARILLHRRVEAVEHRLADQEMADVEFDDLGKRRDLLGGHEIEAVAGMDFEAGALRQRRAARDARELGGGRVARRRPASASHQAPV